ncbi:MAG: hypothetical protein QXL94_00115 [Candidatus Parvarchaeum sp.]
MRNTRSLTSASIDKQEEIIRLLKEIEAAIKHIASILPLLPSIPPSPYPIIPDPQPYPIMPNPQPYPIMPDPQPYPYIVKLKPNGYDENSSSD